MTKIMLGDQQDVIEHIKSSRLDILQPINEMGDTIGHYAAYRGHYQILTLLLSKGDKLSALNTVVLLLI